MCGIAGYVHWGRDRPPPDLPDRFIGALRHRGPDEEGKLFNDRGTLAMARLSVMDPAAGHQPYVSPDGKVAAVFNGEIYNFQTLLDQVRSSGYPLKSHADGEVIVPLYLEHGFDFLKRLSGMFAIALWDMEKETLILARDPMGVKPYFYAETKDGGVVFASEATTLFQCAALKREIDPAVLHGYLATDAVPNPHCLFKGIRQVPPGEAVIAHPDSVRLLCHHSYPRPAARPEVANDDVLPQLERELDAAVAKRLVADVPVGIFVSGGLDSTAVALTALRHNPQLETFFCAVRYPSFDDSHVLRDVAALLGKDPHVIEFRPEDITHTLHETATRMDQPLGDASLLPTYVLCREARKHVTVALVGDGADETLGGYPTYLAHRYYRQAPWLWRAMGPTAMAALHRLPANSKYLALDYLAARFFRGIHEPRPAHRHLLWMQSWSREEREALLGLPSPAPEDMMPYLPWAARQATVDETVAMLMDQRHYFHDNLLVKADRASMLHGLELRSPFLDRDFVAWTRRLSPWQLLGQRTTKKPLRDLLRKGGQDRLASLPKKGFAIPTAHWLTTEGHLLLSDLLRHGKAVTGSLVNPQPAHEALGEHLAGRADRRKELYTLVFFLLWYEKHF